METETRGGVAVLPVKKRVGKDGDVIKLVFTRECEHERFLVDEAKPEVECAQCGEVLSAMWVLRKLSCEESRWRALDERYQSEMKRLSERRRTKCQCCGQMTEISRR